MTLGINGHMLEGANDEPAAVAQRVSQQEQAIRDAVQQFLGNALRFFPPGTKAAAFFIQPGHPIRDTLITNATLLELHTSLAAKMGEQGIKVLGAGAEKKDGDDPAAELEEARNAMRRAMRLMNGLSVTKAAHDILAAALVKKEEAACAE